MLFKRIMATAAASTLLVACLSAPALADDLSPTPPADAPASTPVEAPAVDTSVPAPEVAPAAPVQQDVVLSTKPKPVEHKDWVCKYVGKPGVDERLKSGNDGLVWVDTHATQGSWFNDAQGRSYVLLANVAHDPKPDASQCPPADNPGPQPEPKVVVTTSDPTFGPIACNATTYVKTWVETTTTTPYVLVDGKWVLGTPVVTTKTLTDTVPIPAEQQIKDQSTNPSAPCFVPPAPKPCVASGAWFTEDVAPAITPDGWLFAGPSAAAVDYYHPVSGNLQGLTSESMTISAASGYHVALVWEINRYGTTGYATIVAEPYLNGWAPGQTGTFTVTQSTLVWTSKIASGPGSQSQPIALSAMAALFPTNTLITEGLHLGTHSVEGQSSLVSALGGCLSGSLVITKPAALSGVVKTDSTPVCVEPKDGTATVTHTETPWTQEYVWSDQQTAFVLGEKVYGEPVVTTSTVSDEGCIPTAPTYEPTVETTYTAWVDGTFKCGDTAVAQTRTKTVTTTTFHAVWGDGGYTKVADKPTVVTSTETQNRTLTAADLATLTCSTPTPTPTVTVTVTPTPTATTVAVVGKAAPAALASTGANWLSVALTAGLVLLAGTALTVLSVRHRREQ